MGAVVTISILSLGVFWLPWLLKIDRWGGIEFRRYGMEAVVRNFDGLQYLAVAKSWYDSEIIIQNFAALNNPPEYYAAHLPLYPAVIAVFDQWMPGPTALLASIVFNNLILGSALYLFAANYLKDKKKALLVATIMLFFPARMISLRAVGASEPLFIAAILFSLVALKREKIGWAAGWATLAIVTRITGIIYLAAVVAAMIYHDWGNWSKLSKKLMPFTLPIVGLGLVFYLYQLQLGDYWAYLRGGKELHPVYFWPLLIFSNTQKWITGIWREEFVYMMVFYGAGIKMWWDSQVRSGRELGSMAAGLFLGLIGILLLLTAHQDLARYALVISPMVVLAFAERIERRSLVWALLVIIPGYLLGWQFLVGNMQALADWGVFL